MKKLRLLRYWHDYMTVNDSIERIKCCKDYIKIYWKRETYPSFVDFKHYSKCVKIHKILLG